MIFSSHGSLKGNFGEFFFAESKPKVLEHPYRCQFGHVFEKAAYRLHRRNFLGEVSMTEGCAQLFLGHNFFQRTHIGRSQDTSMGDCVSYGYRFFENLLPKFSPRCLRLIVFYTFGLATHEKSLCCCMFLLGAHQVRWFERNTPGASLNVPKS